MQSSIRALNRFNVALSGGGTPRELFACLAKPDLASRVTWEAVHLFWGDERCVLPGHPDSNYRMAMESLSLFPPAPALNESTRWTVAVEHTTPPPPYVPHVTLPAQAIRPVNGNLSWVIDKTTAALLPKSR